MDFWLSAVRWLRLAWQKVPGDLLGLTVMRASGIHRPTRVVTLDDVTAVVVEDPRVGRRVPLDERTLVHESEHIRQWRRWGPLYLPLYFGSSGLALLRGRHPYDDNWFEVAARRRVDRES
jgi:hypothetical protein